MATNTDQTKLVVLPYLQEWHGSSLELRLLLIPRDDPRTALAPNFPNFAQAVFVFEIRVVPGLDALPAPGAGTVVVTTTLPAIATAQPIFDGVVADLGKKGWSIDPNPPGAGRTPAPGTTPAPSPMVQKHLPLSYQQASGYAPDSNSSLFTTDDTYSCSIKMRPMPPKPYVPIARSPVIAWGRLIASILRFPKLAEAAGLVRSLNGISVDPTLVKDGGYVFLSLTTTSGVAALPATAVTYYASRFPPLDTPRDLFTPVLFPVAATGVSTPSTPLDYGDIFADAEDYDDGWAKCIHSTQCQRLDPLIEDDNDSPRHVKEMGVRLGWDDERVTSWMNRQLSTNATVISQDSPLGVYGYRIDVQNASANGPWVSLAIASGACIVNGNTYATYNGTTDELGVEVHPARDLAISDSNFWLPMYFTNWTGPSLVGVDDERIKFAGGKLDSITPKVRGIVPAGLLVYGNDYNFRVRLMDHTGGGPVISSSPANPGPSLVSHQPFRRWIPPLAPTVVNSPGTPDPDNAPTSIELGRPLILFPAVLCTGKYTSADIPVPVSPDTQPEPGLPDPDVEALEISVLVGTLHQDPQATDGTYKPLYQTTRFFSGNSITLQLKWDDYNDITDSNQFNISLFQAATTGPIVLPTARDIRLRIHAICKEDDQLKYFGAPDVRRGPWAIVALRKKSTVEIDFFNIQTQEQSTTINAYFLQPDTPVLPAAQKAAGKPGQIPPDVSSRLATALQLRNTNLSFRPPPGDRVLVGCSAALRHTTGPDLASITFASNTDLSLHWIIVIRFTINRDWTWDGLDQNGLVVKRDGVEVVRMSPNYSVSHDVVSFPVVDSSHTNLIIFDAIDPKPLTGEFPQILSPSYAVSYSCNGKTTSGPQFSIKLPVATAPLQVPKIVSAGIAMSDYTPSADYSSTAARVKRLWIEFAEPVQDLNDQYFARVLRSAPDPLLLGLFDWSQFQSTDEPELAIDPEPIRRIVPGEADDRSGFDSMQQLTKASSSDVHYYLPLPLGLTDTSPELFGFFTYELRVGHAGVWSTAQGRFSPPLRVAGVQHPPPQLLCSVSRTATMIGHEPVMGWFDINVSAPYALPVVDGVITLGHFVDSPSLLAAPRQMWALLYAQACELDDPSQRRNVLLLEPQQMFPVGKTGVIESVANDVTSVSIASQANAQTAFGGRDVNAALLALGFRSTARLSVLVVEMLPNVPPPEMSKPPARVAREHLSASSSSAASAPAPAPPARPKSPTSSSQSQRQQQHQGVGLQAQAQSTNDRSFVPESANPLADGMGSQRILRTSLLTPVPTTC